MSSKIVKLTEKTAIIICEDHQEIGADLEFEIKLPEEILLESFTLNGVVIESVFARNNGSTGYMTEMEIGNLSTENRLILKAYLDFLEREKELEKIKIDYDAIKKAISNVEKCFIQAVAIAEQFKKVSTKKITLH